MKKTLFFILLFSCFMGFAQHDAWVYFNIKNISNNPLLILSKRTIERRVKHNIASDSKDIPNNQYEYGIPDFSLSLSKGLGIETFLSPNPISDLSVISFLNNLDAGIIKLFSPLGQKVFEQPSVSLKALQADLYLNKLNIDGNITSGKLIKQYVF